MNLYIETFFYVLLKFKKLSVHVNSVSFIKIQKNLSFHVHSVSFIKIQKNLSLHVNSVSSKPLTGPKSKSKTSFYPKFSHTLVKKFPRHTRRQF